MSTNPTERTSRTADDSSRSHTEYTRGRTRCPRCGSHLPAPESTRSDGGCRNCTSG